VSGAEVASRILPSVVTGERINRSLPGKPEPTKNGGMSLPSEECAELVLQGGDHENLKTLGSFYSKERRNASWIPGLVLYDCYPHPNPMRRLTPRWIRRNRSRWCGAPQESRSSGIDYAERSCKLPMKLGLLRGWPRDSQYTKKQTEEKG
jgi:hypothetical protein